MIKGYILGGAVLDLKSSNKYDALRELIHKNQALQTTVKDIKNLEKSVIEREKLLSTGVGHGIAIAHGKSRELNNIVIVVGISQRGIEYNSPDGEPVKLIFLIASPPDRHFEYLLALSCLAKIFTDEYFRSEIIHSRSSRYIERKITEAFLRVAKARYQEEYKQDCL